MSLLKKIYFYLKSHFIVKKNIDYKRDKCDDRHVLEKIIFPHVLAQFNPQTIIDIGREDYQKFYNEFFKGRELWTLDIDPKRKEFGADNHIVDCASNLKKHFQDDYFDFILMNGVFGWGLNKKRDIRDAFDAIYEILKPGGIFILGWNDDIVPLEKITGLKKLRPYYFKPLKGDYYECNSGAHVYNFYVK